MPEVTTRSVECKCGNKLLEVTIGGSEIKVNLVGGERFDTEFHCRNCDRVWELTLNPVQTQAIDMGSAYEEDEPIPLLRGIPTLPTDTLASFSL